MLASLLLCNCGYSQSAASDLPAASSLRRDVDQLQSKVRVLEAENRELRRNFGNLLSSPGFSAFVMILFGAFSALWAQNTGRNAWLWFFLGFIFNVITIFVLLFKNASDFQTKKLASRRRKMFTQD